MLYCEFVEGTGCKDSQKNYEIYKNLEIMYMNSDMTKQEIYEYGKKLVDNSKSESEVEVERQIASEIESMKDRIEYLKNDAERYERYISEEDNEDMRLLYCGIVRQCKIEISALKKKIRVLKVNS